MADVTITGRTPGPCGCCAAPVPPSASAECKCDSTSGVYCDSFTGCTPVAPCDPLFRPPCANLYLTPNPADCPGCGSGLILTSARAQCVGLIVGRTYKVTIHFFALGMAPPQDTEITFTASATTHTTGYYPLPTPDEENPVWLVFGVDIVQL